MLPLEAIALFHSRGYFVMVQQAAFAGGKAPPNQLLKWLSPTMTLPPRGW